MKALPNSLITLGFSHFGLHIPLCQDISKGGTNNSPLELLSTSGTLLLNIFFLTLLVLPPENKTVIGGLRN